MNSVTAQLQNSKILLQLLKSLNFSECCLIGFSPDGVKLTAEEAKCFQASAFIQKDLFKTFELKTENDDDDDRGDEDIKFKIGINSLIETLSAFNGSSSASSSTTLNSTQFSTPASNSSSSHHNPMLYLKYDEEKAEEGLKLLMEESGVIVEIGARARSVSRPRDRVWQKH